MKIIITTVAGLVLAITCAHAQIINPKPASSIITGSSLPATCNVNPTQIYSVVSGGVTSSYYCSATNTWSAFGSGSGGMKTRTCTTGDSLDTYSGYQSICNSSSPVALTISAPSSLPVGYVGIISNRGTGTVTLTLTSGGVYVNGVYSATLTVGPDQSANIALDPDGTDFTSQRSLIAGTNVTLGSDGSINASGGGSGTSYLYGTASSTVTAAGNVEVQGGINTGGGPAGLTERWQQFSFTGTFTQWGLVCQSTSAANTVTNCPASPYVVVGVAVYQPTATTVMVAMEGSTIPINASAAVTVGHTACGGTTVGYITDSGASSACQLQQTVGIVQAITGTWQAFPDGTAFPTLSSTLPLVLLKNINPTFNMGSSYCLTKYSTSLSGLITCSGTQDNGTSAISGEPLYTLQGHALDISTTTVAITGTSFTTTGYYFPATTTIAAKSSYIGRCHIAWQQATAVGTVQFAIATSAAPTHLFVTSSTNPQTLSGATPYTTSDITTATTTAVTAAITPGTINTTYFTDLDVDLSQSTTANTLTLYGLTSSASDALNILPGTSCKW